MFRFCDKSVILTPLSFSQSVAISATVAVPTISVAAEARGDALARLDCVARPRLDVEAGEGHRRLPQARLRRRLQPRQARRQAPRAVGRAAQLGPEAAPVEAGGTAPRALQNGESEGT